jgi:YD repeat-containing protein
MVSMEGNAMPIRDFNGAPNVVRSRVTTSRLAGALCALLALGPMPTSAQDGLFDYQEYERKVKGSQSLAAISADAVFGDRTSSFDGSTEFVVEDVSLPGNFDLPVSVVRRYGVESMNRAIDGSQATGLDLFDDWEIQVPYMSGVWTNRSGWVTGDGAAQGTQRCSVNVAPTIIEGHAYAAIAFGIDVKWHGGATEELLVPDDPTYASAAGLEPPRWMTQSRARFTCLPGTKNGYPGEAFVGHTPDGKKYYFDWGVEKPYAIGKYADGAVNRMVGRKRVYLLASRVEDRFGNWVSYSYDGYRLGSIDASDGRRIVLAYDGQGRVASVTANARQWRYLYSPGSAANDGGLSQVVLPDGSQWTYTHAGTLRSRNPYRHSDGDDQCAIRAGTAPPPTRMTVTAPTGAHGVFDFEMQLFVRSDPCNGLQPAYYDTWALQTRTTTGPGLETLVARRNYNLKIQDGAPGKWVSLLRPDGTEVRERYGTDPGLDERKLLQRQVRDASGQILRDERNNYLHGSEDGPFPRRIGRSVALMSGQFLAGTLSAVGESQVHQDGDTYTVLHEAFDRYTRPHVFHYTGPSGTRSEVRSYHDSALPWVLDQVSKVSEATTGRATAEFVYNAQARPIAVYRAGLLQQRANYAHDGSLSVAEDANGNQTQVSDWHRGVPRLVVNADGSTQRMGVDDNGWITSATDARGYTTTYRHDALGRVNEIRPPEDENGWLPSSMSFRQMPSEAYGLAAGHWRVDRAQGARREETYLDALWRPVLTRSYDANDVAGTIRYTRAMFDSEGREVFSSYPSRTSAASTGIWNHHDALGRVTGVGQDSEHGVLLTHYAFHPNATVVRTDPAGRNTVTRFEAFDAPDYEKPAHIMRPDGSQIRINRNVFGLTTDVAQSAN